MLNGKASATVYYGAFVLIGIIIIAVSYLSSRQQPTPNIFETIIAALLAFIAGAHIKPPVAGKSDDTDETATGEKNRKNGNE